MSCALESFSLLSLRPRTLLLWGDYATQWSTVINFIKPQNIFSPHTYKGAKVHILWGATPYHTLSCAVHEVILLDWFFSLVSPFIGARVLHEPRHQCFLYRINHHFSNKLSGHKKSLGPQRHKNDTVLPNIRLTVILYCMYEWYSERPEEFMKTITVRDVLPWGTLW